MEPRTSPICNNEDRISKLQEPLIHHILSFLHMKHAVQTSVLSKRWRNLWASLPTLNLLDTLSLSPEPKLLKGFIDFVDRVLFLRDSTDIERFYLVWVDDMATGNRLNTWILAAIKRNVQDLCISATVFEKIWFPPCLFTSKSLTNLWLEMGNSHRSEIVLHNSMCLPRLKYLKLGSLYFSDENSSSKLISSCPFLESLFIRECHTNFNVSSPSLKHFELQNPFYGYHHNGAVKTVKLYAPNLTSFICKDHISQEYYLENLYSLVTADIDLSLEECGKNQIPEAYSKLSTRLKELYAQRMMKFLVAVCNVKDLKLSAGFLEWVSGAPNLSSVQPPQFGNLQCLQLQTWISRNCMDVITYLLNISPNIESLSLTVTKVKSAYQKDDWVAKLPSACMLNHLKFVKIQGFIGCVNEFKLLEILLKNSMVLEKVVLLSSGEDSPDEARQKMEFKENLLLLPRASSSVSILCQS